MTRQHTRICGWIAAIVFASVFAWLGTWQLQRMHDKQALLAQAPLADAPALALAQALEQPSVLHRIRDHGRFLPGTVLLDNQLRQGRAGVRVYQPFRPAASATTVLVDLGWLPLPGNRVLPTIVPLHGEHALQGLLAPAPAAGLALGPALVDTAQPGVWLATRIDSAAISTRLQLDGGALAAAVLRLDPALPLGYARDLELLPNTLPPARHLGYAVQWYALALTVLVIALLLEWRARRRNGR